MACKVVHSVKRLVGVLVPCWCGALLGRKWSAATDSQKTAYGLGSYAAISLALYDVVAAPVLILGAVESGGAGLWGAALLYSVVVILFMYAFAMYR